MDLTTPHTDEQVVKQFTISPRLVWFIAGAGIVVVLLAPLAITLILNFLGINLGSFFLAVLGLTTLIGLLLLGYGFYLRVARQYLLTNQRVITTIGWLARNTDSVSYEYITNIDVDQDMFERFILGTGRVNVETASAPADVIYLERVANPYQVAAQIRELAEVRLKQIGHSGATTASTGIRMPAELPQAAEQPAVAMPPAQPGVGAPPVTPPNPIHPPSEPPSPAGNG